MTAGLRVIRPGLRSLVQDMGFVRGRALGVPLCGALDREALWLLNRLLGNPVTAPAIELVLTAPVLRAEGAAVRLALGPGLSAQIDGAGPPRRIQAWQAVTLNPGETLVIDPPERGAPSLIGLGGGLDLPEILGSRATCLAAGFGGFSGRALCEGDLLPVPAAPLRPDALLTPPPPPTGPIRVVAGPQDERFGTQGLRHLTETLWEVGAATDRMGMRLSGPPVPFAPGQGPDILSEGVVPGAIQVPGNGLPIVLRADAQTTGGYAKIATVIRADLPRLARLMPGEAVRLSLVTLPEAEAAARARQGLLEAAAKTIRPLGQDTAEAERLWQASLIGGMVDMERPDHFPGALPLKTEP